MYVNSDDRKDNRIGIRISNNKKKQIEKYMEVMGLKTISEFFNMIVDEKLENGGKLFN